MSKTSNLAFKLFSRIILVLTTCIAFCGGDFRSARADAAPPPDPSVGSAGPYQPQKTNVQMMAETVVIDAPDQKPLTDLSSQDEDYHPEYPKIHVNAVFTMRNQGKTEEKMQVIFPLTQLTWPTSEDSEYRVDRSSFAVKVNGQSVPTTEINTPAEEGYIYEYDQKSGETIRGFQDSVLWAAFDVTFPVRKNVTLDVSYNMEGYYDGTYQTEFQAINYILETGAGWYGEILSADLILRLPYQATEEAIRYANPGYKLSGNEISWHLKNIEPTHKDNLSVGVYSPEVWRGILKLRTQVAQNPKSAEAWYRLANGYMSLAIGFYMQDDSYYHIFDSHFASLAVAAYQKTISLQPEWGAAHLMLAKILWVQNFSGSDNVQLEDPNAQKVLHELELAHSYGMFNISEAEGLYRDINRRIPGLELQLQPPAAVTIPVFPTEDFTAQTAASEISDGKGVNMLLIPKGEFIMGSVHGETDEQPVHKVSLDAYYIDQHEVTIASYKTCVAAGVCAPLTDTGYSSAGSSSINLYTNYYTDPKFNNFPVYVTWEMANTYCGWRGSGTRLPTEAEWEKAARGTDGRDYPWGETGDAAWLNSYSNTEANFGMNVGVPSPVGFFKKDRSVYGLYDTAGNIDEWVSDWYGADYYHNSPSTNPKGPDTGESHLSRGGSWARKVLDARLANRSPQKPQSAVGVRCARSLAAVIGDTSPTPSPTITAQPTLEATPAPTQIQSIAISAEPVTDDKGVTMMRVPAGRFKLGDQQQRYLDSYDIDQYEVSNSLYKTCVDAGVCAPPKQTYSFTRPKYYGNPEFAGYPVINVDWNMARSYCEWRGGRLPTVAEWEKAAHGTEGFAFPWGSGIDKTNANYGQNVGDTSAVNDYLSGRSIYGVYGMAGNVWEWTADFYDSRQYFGTNKPIIPTGSPDSYFSTSRFWHLIKGGSWYNDAEIIASFEPFLSVRGDYANILIGFRCARSIPPVQSDSSSVSGPAPAAPVEKELVDAKGITMKVIPTGEFIMGSENGDTNEMPVHKVYLDSFAIDKFEVTNALYKACEDAKVCKTPDGWNSASSRNKYYGNPEFDDYPVINVDWNRAKAYCEWRGARLPTEAEWEKAARGTDGRTYPWGDGIDNTFANFNLDDTTKVGSYEKGKSIYGVYDMAGNVWEWVNDWYDPAYYQKSPSSNPLGPETGEYHILRGGSWYIADFGTRSAYRSVASPGLTSFTVGFRCAKSLQKSFQ